MAAHFTDILLYLDVGAPAVTLGAIMVLLKHFDASKQTLLGVGKQYISNSALVSDLIPVINRRMGQAPDTALTLYAVRPYDNCGAQRLTDVSCRSVGPAELNTSIRP
jgi:hypothetical protein